MYDSDQHNWKCRGHLLDGVKEKRNQEKSVAVIMQLLRGKPDGLRPADILKHIFNLSNMPSDLARTMVSGILEGNDMFCFHEGAWRLVEAEFTNLDSVPFVVVDVETTGGRPRTNRVIEIGAFKVANGRITSSMMTLINPGRHIPLQISMLTGIYDVHVANSPKVENVLPAFLSFVGDGVFVGHNARFDYAFMNAELSRSGMQNMKNETVCTIKLTRRLFPGESSYGLDNLIRKFDLQLDPTERHRGHGDAWATAEILIRCLDLLRGAGVNYLEELLRILAIPAARARRELNIS